MKGGSKYKSQKMEVNGIIFASKKEARKYSELFLLEKGKVIRDLVLQPRFDIIINDKYCGFYKADFSYFDNTLNKAIILDVKGMRTPVFNLKKKIVEALYNIEITLA